MELKLPERRILEALHHRGAKGRDLFRDITESAYMDNRVLWIAVHIQGRHKIDVDARRHQFASC